MIYSYSRKQAIEDGVLVDVSGPAKLAGFIIPVAITQAAHEVTCPDLAATYSMLRSLRSAISMLVGAIDTVEFNTFASVDGQRGLVKLKAVCSPGDTADPVITVMLPNED